MVKALTTAFPIRSTVGMEKVKNNKRIEWIDSLKGAMMLAVIWSHSSANNTSG